MSWADNLNILLNTSKMFGDNARANRDRALGYAQLGQRSVETGIAAKQAGADRLAEGIGMFGENIGKGIEAGRQRAYDWNKMEAEQGFKSAEAEKERGFTEEQNKLTRQLTTDENLLDRQAQTARDKFAREGYQYTNKTWYNPWNGATRQYSSTNEGEHDINLKDIDAWIEMARAQWTKDNLGKTDDIDNEDNFRRAAAEEAEIIDRYIRDNALLPDFTTLPDSPNKAWDVYDARNKLFATPEIQEMVRAAKAGLSKRYPNTWSARTNDGKVTESVDQILFPMRGKPEGIGLDYSENIPTETGNVSPYAANVIPPSVSGKDLLSAGWATITGLFTGKSKEEISQDPRLMRIAEKRDAKENIRASGIEKNEENYYKDLLTAKDTINEYHSLNGATPSINATTALNNINSIIDSLTRKDLTGELKKYDTSFKQKYGMTAEQVLKQLIGYYAQNWSERGGEQEYYSGSNERYKPSNNMLQAFTELASLLGR